MKEAAMFALARRLPGQKNHPFDGVLNPNRDDIFASRLVGAGYFTAASASAAARGRMFRAGERPLAVANWERALFIHFAIDPAVLQPHVPFPLDLCEGRAYVSLVAFTQTNVRPT